MTTFFDIMVHIITGTFCLGEISFLADQYSAALYRRGEYGLLKSPSCDIGLDCFLTWRFIVDYIISKINDYWLNQINDIELDKWWWRWPKLELDSSPAFCSTIPVCVWSPTCTLNMVMLIHLITIIITMIVKKMTIYRVFFVTGAPLKSS